MLDRDGDSRTDAVRLVYSERVRHVVDSDGSYPFRIAGYRIRSVGKSRGKTILVTLGEPAATDDLARPAVVYRRTRAGSVVDRARNRARAQVFRATKARGQRPSPVSDRDRDGTPNERDCAPDDATIHPRAAGQPDLAFVDSNCDGIDGDETDAIFVARSGSDQNRGTKAAPKREIKAAVTAAALAGKDVYAAAGDYDNRVETVSGVNIYGGYVPGT